MTTGPTPVSAILAPSGRATPRRAMGGGAPQRRTGPGAPQTGER